MQNNYLQEIIKALNCFLPSEQAQVNSGNIVFAHDANVDYQGEQRRVRQSEIIPVDQFETRIAPLFDDGPSWIHANVIPTRDHHFLVTIAVGKSIRHPHPSINVSHELNRTAEITH